MTWIGANLWLIPALPLGAAALTAGLGRARRATAAALAISSLAASFGLAVVAFAVTVAGARGAGGSFREAHAVFWLALGRESLRLGWVLDPLSAAMLVMVTFVGLLIFVYSVGYMAHDENFTRFFGFLSLFAAGMLGLVMANHLLLLFGCWELVGLASYLLIGFWYHKPAAAAAAKKAFITTRVGDLGFLLGLVWLYGETGTLMLYEQGNGCLEGAALSHLATKATIGGCAVATAIALLVFCGAAGKSGQVPLHVWLPDAMEGPTPVSALIHAATMVAAGVFLVARVYPLFGAHGFGAPAETPALQVVAWVGAGTAVLAAGIAVAQADMKRILAYSTVSQLGFMMLGLGVGGVAVGMFHLMTHAAFKALLFLGAGSVIHGAHEEQDIRRLGGLWRAMPITFATYAIGMMALAGVPLAASGFWSKDAILHAAHGWPVSQGPFALGLVGVLLTAFYMTRQVCHVFFGRARNPRVAPGRQPAAGGRLGAECASVRESPPLMTVPLLGLAGVTLLAGLVGTPVWPWFQGYLEGSVAGVDWTRLWRGETLVLMAGSGTIVAIGVTAGWWWYGRTPLAQAHDPDVLERWWPSGFALLRDRLRFDELYDVTAVRGTDWFAAWCDRLDFLVWGAAVAAVEWLVLGLSWASHLFDQHVVNLGFDTSCERLRRGGRFASALQDGQAQNYLCALAGGLVLLLLLLNWDAGR